MKRRIEEFIQDGKNFIYFDLSGSKTNDDYEKVIEEAKTIILKYHEQSVYTITNIRNVTFDTETKEIVAKWMKHNKPYVKCGAVIGMDGIKKIMVNAILKISNRTNMEFFNTKEQAVEWLLKQ